MPSKARTAFDESSQAVEQLLEIHKDVGGAAPGKRRLEVLNKSAVVLITALWEAYCEDLAAEALATIVDHAADATALPKDLRKRIAKEVKDAQNELSPWELADDKWRARVKSRLADLTADRNTKLNTPKTSQINELFAQAVGISIVSDKWTWRGKSPKDTAQALDAFIKLRGSIAHRGSAAASVHRKHAEDYLDLVRTIIRQTGGTVNTFVKAATGKSLW